MSVNRLIFRSFLLLIVGLVVGFYIAEFFLHSTPHRPHAHEFPSAASGPETDVGTHEHVDTNITIKLYNEVRVLCWIMTNPENHKTKALHVMRTWGKRCNKLIFMSSTVDDTLSSVALPVYHGKNNLWAKTKEAHKYIYANHMNDADWFLKADDETYAIVENLRFLLYRYTPETPIYFGCKFKPFVKQDYASGCAGYVLSKEAVRRFVEEAIPNPKLCDQGNSGLEDFLISKCLANIKVIAGDPHYSQKRDRFLPVVPEDHLMPSSTDEHSWYWKYIYYKIDKDLSCSAENAFSFHNVSPDLMYVLEYLIYHLRPYGVVNIPKPLPEKLTMAEIKEQSETTSYLVETNVTERIK